MGEVIPFPQKTKGLLIAISLVPKDENKTLQLTNLVDDFIKSLRIWAPASPIEAQADGNGAHISMFVEGLDANKIEDIKQHTEKVIREAVTPFNSLGVVVTIKVSIEERLIKHLSQARVAEAHKIRLHAFLDQLGPPELITFANLLEAASLGGAETRIYNQASPGTKRKLIADLNETATEVAQDQCWALLIRIPTSTPQGSA